MQEGLQAPRDFPVVVVVVVLEDMTATHIVLTRVGKKKRLKSHGLLTHSHPAVCAV